MLTPWRGQCRNTFQKKDISESIADNARKIVETHSEKVLFDKWDEFLRKI